jgi:hypothetical protein
LWTRLATGMLVVLDMGGILLEPGGAADRPPG